MTALVCANFFYYCFRIKFDSGASRVNTDDIDMIMILPIHCENFNNNIQIYNIFVPLKLC